MGLVLAEQSLQSDNALSSITSTQAGGGGGARGVVTGLTMPCQSINTTQPGGVGGGG